MRLLHNKHSTLKRFLSIPLQLVRRVSGLYCFWRQAGSVALTNKIKNGLTSRVRTKRAQTARLLGDVRDLGPRLALRKGKEKNAWQQRHYQDYRDLMAERLNRLAKRHGSPKGIGAGLGVDRVDNWSADFCDQEWSTIETELNRWPTSNVEDLVRFYRLYGRLTVAWRLRSYYRERLINAQSSASNPCVPALQAALEVGRPEYVIDVVRSKGSADSIPPSVRELLAFAYLLIGDTASCDSVRASLRRRDDEWMINEFRAQTLAVVGPAPLDAATEVEISECAKIVRPNVILASGQNHSQQSIYSYYNIEKVLARSDDIRRSLASLRAASFKSNDSLNLVEQSDDQRHAMLRVMRQANVILLNDYGPNAIQNILYDLTWFAPKRIKLYGTTAFVSTQVSRPGYKDPGFDARGVRAGLRIHEPFSNFCFLKNLLVFGIIEADTVSTQVLTRSDREYAKLIDDLYGEYPIDAWQR